MSDNMDVDHRMVEESDDLYDFNRAAENFEFDVAQEFQMDDIIERLTRLEMLDGEMQVKVQFNASTRFTPLIQMTVPKSMTIAELRPVVYRRLFPEEDEKTKEVEEDNPSDTKVLRTHYHTHFPEAKLNFIFKGKVLGDDRLPLAGLKSDCPYLIAWCKTTKDKPILYPADMNLAYDMRATLAYVFNKTEKHLVEANGPPTADHVEQWHAMRELMYQLFLIQWAEQTLGAPNTGYGFEISVRKHDRVVRRRISIQHLGHGLFRCKGQFAHMVGDLLYNVVVPEVATRFIKDGAIISDDKLRRVLNTSNPWERPQMFDNRLHNLYDFLSDQTGLEVEEVRAILQMHDKLYGWKDSDSEAQKFGHVDTDTWEANYVIPLEYVQRLGPVDLGIYGAVRTAWTSDDKKRKRADSK